MSKILAVADIHIHDYPNRNPYSDYRLLQDRVVAKNIIEVGKANGCDTIVFAGDIIEKSLIRSYIQAEVKDFLFEVMSNFTRGYIIWGNHDLDSKSADQNINDSVLGVILPSNLYYAHQKTLKIDNTLIGFSNWQPTFDLSWISGKVDVLFTHARICYSSSGGDIFQSQILDESKFDLAICGDIHKPGTIGKYVSVGIPQRCKLGDSEEMTGVILDCETKQWNYVNLNPHDNLMKFKYTTVENQDGWNDSDKTWYIYRKSDVLSTQNNVVLPAWEEIENLVDQTIINAGLQGTHQEIIKNIKDINAGEVDFNFSLMSLHCKNWRSIDDVTVYFNEGDKILIQGSNGSGKSSLLSALKYAFIDVKGSGFRSLDSFIQFGSKDCLTEVEFMYQNNKYKLTRGTSTWGLEMNDKPFKYGNKSNFEADIRLRFPFIEYMDLFFLGSDHNQLIGGMTDERRNLIISKFLKLDKIDTLHNTAEILYDQFRKTNDNWKKKYDEAKKILEVSRGKLESITVPTISKDILEARKQEGLEIQRRNAEWNRYLANSAKYQAAVELSKSRLQELESEKSNLRSTEVINQEIFQITEEIKIHNSEITDLGSIHIAAESLSKEIENLRSEGNNAWRELQNLGIGKICEHCGQPIQNTEVLNRHKSELEGKISDIKVKLEDLQNRLHDTLLQQEQAKIRLSELERIVSNLNIESGKRMSELNRHSQILEEISKESAKLSQATEELNSLGFPEKVELPENFMEIMESINNQINTWNLWESLMSDHKSYEAELNNCEAELNNLAAILGSLNSYMSLTGPTGQIYYEIFNKLAAKFSDNLVTYSVVKFERNRKDHLDLISQFNNNGHLVEYPGCSSGQKTILDIHFMQKIINRIGLVVMDEFLKHLDSDNHDLCIEMLSGMNIGCLMLSSHMETIAAFNNKTCRLSLESSGLTKIDFN